MSGDKIFRSFDGPEELDLGDLLDLSWNWRPSILLLQAHSSGLFDAAAGGWKTADEIAGKLETNPRATKLTLTGLCGVRLMEKAGDKFRNAPVSEKHLVKSSPDYRGSILDLDTRAAGNWQRIAEVMKSGAPIPKPESNEEEKKAWQETFILAMDDIASQYKARMFEALPIADGHRLLDIGCGPATYMIDFAKRLPALRAVAFDRPLSRDVVTVRAEQAGVEERIEFAGGDFTTDEFNFGGPFDGVLISQILHILPVDQCRDLVRRAAKVTKPGGYVAIHEMSIGPDGDPGPAAVFAIQMMLGTAEGSVFTRDEIAGWMDDAGLELASETRIDVRSEVFVGRKR